MRQYHIHVLQLATRHGIQVKRVLGMNEKLRERSPFAMPEIGYVEVGDLKHENAYLTTLHELGHCVLKHRDKTPRQKLLNEGEAWEWAVTNAKQPPTLAGREFIKWCLSTYVDSFPNDVPGPGSLFHKHYHWTPAAAAAVKKIRFLP